MYLKFYFLAVFEFLTYELKLSVYCFREVCTRFSLPSFPEQDLAGHRTINTLRNQQNNRVIYNKTSLLYAFLHS